MEISKYYNIDRCYYPGIQKLFAEGFVGEKIPRPFEVLGFADRWHAMLDYSESVMFILHEGDEVNGLISGVMVSDMTTGERIAVVINWRVNERGKGWGVKLLETFEDWAKNHEAKYVETHARVDKGLGKTHRKLKDKQYIPASVIYLKEV